MSDSTLKGREAFEGLRTALASEDSPDDALFSLITQIENASATTVYLKDWGAAALDDFHLGGPWDDPDGEDLGDELIHFYVYVSARGGRQRLGVEVQSVIICEELPGVFSFVDRWADDMVLSLRADAPFDEVTLDDN